MTSILSTVALAPRDPILGINEAYSADTRPQKVNLGVGVYYDEQGHIPLLPVVRDAEQTLIARGNPHGYLPIDGLKSYDQAVQALVLGTDSPLIAQKRAVTVQALGGTGALTLGADIIHQFRPDAVIAISDPTWQNHRGVFEAAGFAAVQTYRYYDAARCDVNREGMLEDLRALPKGSVAVLHVCCHNPTGLDLSEHDWRQVQAVCTERELVPFLDMAYQGFGHGLHEDALAVRLFTESGMPAFISSSFSKSFSLYGERVGALTVLTGSADEAERVLSQLKAVARTNYSNPPGFGAAIVATVLGSDTGRKQWEQELAAMCRRIRAVRETMVQQLTAKTDKRDFTFVLRQNGMFSYSGLSAAQVEKLKTGFGIYAVSNGRICVAALNDNNLDYVTTAIASVL